MPPATTTVLELAANHPETIGERLSEQARLIPHKVLLVTGERAVTFRQMGGHGKRYCLRFCHTRGWQRRCCLSADAEL